MSSPLDGRIRALAREEAAALLGNAPVDADSTGHDRVAALEKEVVELRGNVKHLYARLDAMERTATQTNQEPQAAARRTRKAG